MHTIIPKSWEQIKQDLQPKSPEAIPDWLYDTQTYTDNATTELTFFAASQADRSVSNLQSGGALPADTALYLYNIYVDYYNNAAGTPYVSSTTAATENVGNINDIGLLAVNGRGRLTLTLANKEYGPWPLNAFGGLGAVQGFGWGTVTAEETMQYGHNALHNRGWIGGAIVLPPQIGFSVRINWPAAVDLTGDYRVRVVLAGTRYRKVQ